MQKMPLPDHPPKPAPPAHARSASRINAATKYVAAFLGAALVCVIARLLMNHSRPLVGQVEALIFPLLAAAAVVGLIIRQELRWDRPARKLAQLAEDVRRGQLPIESLNDIHGGIAPLTAVVQTLLRDAREAKRANAELNDQIRARVAARTDALERAIGSLKVQATVDKLTGLHNRRMLDELLPRLADECVRRGEPCCVVMIDVDHFKLLNDTLGHDAGDMLLRDIGRLIGSSLRGGDAAFRPGGDEFVIALPNTTLEGAQGTATRIARLVDALGETLRVRPAPRLSFGVASTRDASAHTDPAARTTEMLRIADARLYAAKRERRAATPQLDRRSA